MPYVPFESQVIAGHALHDGFVASQQQYDMDMDLCALLQTMRLSEGIGMTKTTEMQEPLVALPSPPSPTSVSNEFTMEPDFIEQPTRNTDPQSSSQVLDSQPAPTPFEPVGPSQVPCGCAYLQTIHCQFEDYTTTNGSYLDAIFTHREILYSYPAAHQDCADAFNKLAYLLETRAWRADRDADMEAVVAFRHEAWSIANMFTPKATTSQQTSACVMPMMW